MYDVIIIGAGAAGITAGIYAARANLKFEILSKDIGGLTLWSPDIENYTGYHNITGMQLIEKFKEHMADYDINIKEETVEKVEKTNEGFIVKSNNQEYNTKTIVICTGSSPRRLDVKGAEEFEGKGLAYCATCDGPLFAGKDVAVIGGGDSAISAALTLIQSANKIYILNNAEEMGGKDKTMREKVLSNEKVELINNASTKEVFGEDFVKGLKYEQKGEEKTLDVEGVFVEIGHVRNVDFIKDLIDINKRDEIIVDKSGQTSVKGIYAAGDITDLSGKQTVIACGDGSRALLSAFSYLSRK